jgi:hypothetical protein
MLLLARSLLLTSAVLAPLAAGAAQPPPIADPEEILAPPWLETRRQEQLATTDSFGVFHGFRFVDGIAASGIGFQHRIVDDAGRYYVANHYDHGNGVALADVDGDGRLDPYFVSQIGENSLWHNIGDGSFTDLTATAGVALGDRVGVTASFADTDNDGDADLFVTNVLDGNVLFVGDGEGGFADATAKAGVGYQGHSSASVFFDYNRDGLVDLFVANIGQYTRHSAATEVVGYSRDQPEHANYHVGFDDAFAGHLKPQRQERSILYENNGDNHFADVTVERRLVDTSWSGAATPFDANEDGWPDLYVLNMQGHDEYYENAGGDHFVRRSREVFPRTPWGSMGVKVFDFDNDGRLDLYLTDMHSDMSARIGPEREKMKSHMEWPESFLRSGGHSIFGNAFLRNLGGGAFEEISDRIGAENYWPWGLSTGDLNADGFEDAFVTSSMNYTYRYGVNSLLLNDRGERFRDSEFILGVEPRQGGRTAKPWFEADCSGADVDHPVCAGRSGTHVVWGALGTRSSAIADLDDDGDLDIITNEFNAEPMVLLSDLSDRLETLHYLKVQLRGTQSNRDGLGALVRVHAGDLTYTKVHDGQSGYLAQSLIPLYFGLGAAAAVDSIEVSWPSGTTQTVDGPLAANRLVVVEEL